MTAEAGSIGAERELERVLRERSLHTVFQPIVSLQSHITLGYEALARGPTGSPLADAPSLLTAAYRTGRVAEFDWVARASACRAVMAARLGADRLVFLNIEPLALDSECPPDLWPDIKRVFDTYDVVLEVTERSLDRDPGSVLGGLDRQRSLVAGLALDDVGSNLATLSMLPMAAPAVIKLDSWVTKNAPTAAATKVLDVVYEEAERTGAAILAEGIENVGQARLAHALGASLGQGRYFGEPNSLPQAVGPAVERMHLRCDTPADVGTPFDALPGHLTARTNVDVLAPLCRQLVIREDDLSAPAFLMVLLPGPEMYGAAEHRLLAGLARRGVVTGVLGPGLPADPGNGVRGGRDEYRGFSAEWAVVALSSRSASALLARAVLGGAAEFDFGITHDKQRVIAAARCLFRHMGARPNGSSSP